MLPFEQAVLPTHRRNLYVFLASACAAGPAGPQPASMVQVGGCSNRTEGAGSVFTRVAGSQEKTLPLLPLAPSALLLAAARGVMAGDVEFDVREVCAGRGHSFGFEGSMTVE